MSSAPQSSRSALQAPVESVPRSQPAVPGRLVGIGVGPGDADLLTVRAVEALRRADRVVAPAMAVDVLGRAEATVLQALPGLRVERIPLTVAPDRIEREAVGGRSSPPLGRLPRGRRGDCLRHPRRPTHLLNLHFGRPGSSPSAASHCGRTSAGDHGFPRACCSHQHDRDRRAPAPRRPDRPRGRGRVRRTGRHERDHRPLQGRALPARPCQSRRSGWPAERRRRRCADRDAR